MAQTPIYNGESYAQAVPFKYDVTLDATGKIPFALPEGFIPTQIDLVVETAFNGTTPTMKAGYTGSLAALFDTTDVDLTLTGYTLVLGRGTAPLSANKEIILTVSEGSSTAGLIHGLVRGFMHSPSLGR